MCFYCRNYKLVLCRKTINDTYYTKWICDICKRNKYKTIHPDNCSLYERKCIHRFLIKKRKKMNNYCVKLVY